MNKTIKIIDLLNKIANGEEVPKKIKTKTNTYVFKENAKAIENIYKTDNHLETGWFNKENFLPNDEVEIIEDIDIQEIEELEIIEEGNKAKLKTDTGNYPVEMRELEIICKINAILRSNKGIR